jgi:hypothetical protein
VEDHATLTAAAQHGAVLALWIYEDAVITAEDFDARHLGFANNQMEAKGRFPLSNH